MCSSQKTTIKISRYGETDFSLINILSQSCPIKSIQGLEEESELLTKARWRLTVNQADVSNLYYPFNAENLWSLQCENQN